MKRFIVKKINIRHNGKVYKPGQEIELEKSDYKNLREYLEEVEEDDEEDEEEGEEGKEKDGKREDGNDLSPAGYEKMTVKELLSCAEELGISGLKSKKRDEIISELRSYTTDGAGNEL